MAGEYSDNINGWANALRDCGAVDLSRELIEANGTKPEALERLRQAGLPVQPSLLLNFPDFLKDPQTILKKFEFPLYWTSLLPKDPTLKKYTKIGINSSEVIDFAKEYQALSPSYEVILNPFEENVFGGNIISNSEMILIEMGRCNQTDVAQGRVLPKDLVSAEKKLGSQRFKYSDHDPKIRRIFQRVLRYIKHEDKFMEGYFEFAVTSSPKRKTLGITFFDFKTAPIFLNISSS